MCVGTAALLCCAPAWKYQWKYQWKHHWKHQWKYQWLHNVTKKCSLLTVAFSHVDGGPPLLRPALRDLLQPETEGAASTSGR